MRQKKTVVISKLAVYMPPSPAAERPTVELSGPEVGVELLNRGQTPWAADLEIELATRRWL